MEAPRSFCQGPLGMVGHTGRLAEDPVADLLDPGLNTSHRIIPPVILCSRLCFVKKITYPGCNFKFLIAYNLLFLFQKPRFLPFMILPHFCRRTAAACAFSIADGPGNIFLSGAVLREKSAPVGFSVCGRAVSALKFGCAVPWYKSSGPTLKRKDMMHNEKMYEAGGHDRCYGMPSVLPGLCGRNKGGI